MNYSSINSQERLDTAIIMAGGKGTRLASITGDLPKPMVNIWGTGALYNGHAKDTILEHQIKLLHENGINNFIFVVGNKKEYIQQAFTNQIINRNLGCNDISIRYFEETSPLGTAGAFCSKELQDMIDSKSFLFTYADVLFDVDIQAMFQFYKEHDADAAVLISPCSQPDDRPLCVLKRGGDEITGIIPKQGKTDGPREGFFPNTPKNGLMILNKSFLQTLPSTPTFLDMEENVLSPMIDSKQFTVVGWNTPSYIKDIGTIDRFYEGTRELKQGMPQLKNPNKFPQTCVVVKASDIVCADENGRVTANNEVASAVSVLNNGGVITVVHNDLAQNPNLACDLKMSQAALEVVQDKIVDTVLVRSAGAYPNAQVQNINDFEQIAVKWNILPSDCFYMEKCDGGCSLTKFDGQDSVVVSNFTTTAQAIVDHHNKMQQTYLQTQAQNAFANNQTTTFQTTDGVGVCQ